MSLIFYSWGEPKFILLMIFSIIINYFFGLKLGGRYRKTFLIAAITSNLGILFFFKYWGFLSENINYFFEQPIIEVGNIHLPIGISFFTFQAMSYVIDVYRGQTDKQKSLVNLALYISLFPQLIAGPIVRYQDINKQLLARDTSWSKFSSGVERFLIGLTKKVLIANNFAYLADTIFSKTGGEIDTPMAWVGVLAYTFQIYYDFSGYSDMAIGLGRMLGFEFLENFNYPYISQSIREFWRRWHISLSTWFRDYVYISLGGNRVKASRLYLNLIIVFLLTGLWHGASWNFVVWGLFHGVFLAFERSVSFEKIRLPKFLKHIYALLVVVVGWVFFRAENLNDAIHYLKIMFAWELSTDFPNNIRFLVSKELMWVTIIGLIFSMPVKRCLLNWVKNMSGGLLKLSLTSGYYLLLLILFIISLSYVTADSYSPFIYFRF